MLHKPKKNKSPFRGGCFGLFLERNSDVVEEGFCFHFILCRSDESDRETEDVFEFFISCLWEDRVFFDTECEVSDIVERFGLKSAEVFGSRESDVYELVDKGIHPVTPKRDGLADNFTFA